MIFGNEETSVFARSPKKSSTFAKNLTKIDTSYTFGLQSKKTVNFSSENANVLKVQRQKTDQKNQVPRNNILDILKKTTRNIDEARNLYYEFKNFPFFKRFTENFEDIESDALLFLCQTLTYEVLPPSSIIFEQGDQPNGKVYIIYTGSVNIYIKSLDPILSENMATRAVQVVRQGSFRRDSRRGSIRLDSPGLKTQTPSSPSKTVTKGSKFKQMESQEPEAEGAPSANVQRSLFSVQHANQGEKNESESNSSDQNQVQQSTKHIPTKFGSALNLIQKQSDLNTPTSVMDSKRTEQESPGIKAQQTVGGIVNYMSNFRRKQNRVQTHHHGSPEDGQEEPQTPADIFEKKYGKKVDNLQQGQFFGERALKDTQKRTATVITHEETILLIITRENFESIKHKYDKKKLRMLEVLEKGFPGMETIHSTVLKESLTYYLEDKQFGYGATIIKQNQNGTHLFVIESGEVEIIKNIRLDQENNLHNNVAPLKDFMTCKSKTEAIVIAQLPQYNVFGEEVLYHKKSSYQYTVRVSSRTAVVYQVDRQKFQMRFPRTCHNAVKELYHKKSYNHFQSLKSILRVKYPNCIEEIYQLNNSLIKDEADIMEKNIDLKPKFQPTHYPDPFKVKKQILGVNLDPTLADKFCINTDSNPYRDPNNERIEELKEIFKPLGRKDIYLNVIKFQGEQHSFESDRPKTRASPELETSLKEPQEDKPIVPPFLSPQAKQISIKKMLFHKSRTRATSPEQSPEERFLSPKSNKSIPKGEPPIRSQTSQDGDWRRFYHSVSNSQNFKDLMAEVNQEKDVNNVNLFKFDVGNAIPEIEQKYRAIRIASTIKGMDMKQAVARAKTMTQIFDQQTPGSPTPKQMELNPGRAFRRLVTSFSTYNQKFMMDPISPAHSLLEQDESIYNQSLKELPQQEDHFLPKNVPSFVKKIVPTFSRPRCFSPSTEAGVTQEESGLKLNSKPGSPYTLNCKTYITSLTDQSKKPQPKKFVQQPASEKFSISNALKKLSKKTNAPIQEQQVKKKYSENLKLKKRLHSRQSSMPLISLTKYQNV